MYEKIKKHFPSLQYYETPPPEIDESLTWFISEDEQVISIHPSELEDKDITLLQMFLKPYENIFPVMTEEEKKWRQFIQQENGELEIDTPFRFIYFQIPPNKLQPAAFKEAINQLYEKEVTILWESETDGVIVDIIADPYEEVISLDEIIDILMSDLYINIRFFVSPYLTMVDQVKHYHQRLVTQGKIAFSYSENNVVSYIEAIPFMLIEQLTPDLKEDLQQLISQEFQDDPEFLKIMEIFLKSDLNVSVAAKKLYMHRNSLQYRIEKFKENTGLDIRKFHHALTAYLALLLK